MSKIIGLGNALVDVLVKVGDDNILNSMGLPKGSMQLIDNEKFLEINKIISQMNPSIATGGSAANTIKALATLGSTVGFIGKIGKDSYGDFFKETFNDRGIDTHLLIDAENNSGVASTFISTDGERTFGTHLGAASNLIDKEITVEVLEQYSILYVEGYLVQNHNLILKAVKLAKELGLKVCIDLASYNIVTEDLEFFHYLVENFVDIVFANQEEAYAFAKIHDNVEALKYIANRSEIAIVKVGADGSYIMTNDQIIKAPAVKGCKVVDTTGAGDYFAAGFLYGYIKGCDLDKCARIGALLSANVIEVVGTTLDIHIWDKIKKEIKDIIA